MNHAIKSSYTLLKRERKTIMVQFYASLPWKRTLTITLSVVFLFVHLQAIDLHSQRNVGEFDDLHSNLDSSSNDSLPYSILNIVSTSFADQDSMSICRSNFLASSVTSRKEGFTSRHFASFIKLQSKGMIDKPFNELQATFVLLFYVTACIVCFDTTGDSQCCTVDRANIPTEDEVDASTFLIILDFLCPNIDQLIDNLVTQSPEFSIAPSTYPTFQPSLVPSGLLSSTQSPSSNSYSLSAFPFATPTVADGPNALMVEELDLLCISFTYTLTSELAFSAADIMSENGNTIKQGLLAATKNVTISILNETQPIAQRTLSGAHLEEAQRAAKKALLLNFGNHGIDETIDPAAINRLTLELNRSLRTNKGSARDQRSIRDVYYTNDIPIKITNVAESMFCSGGVVACFFISTELCVVMGPGDGDIMVRAALIQGLRTAINNGSFNSAIPHNLLQ